MFCNENCLKIGFFFLILMSIRILIIIEIQSDKDIEGCIT
jgi:hypothetical protein